MAIYTRRNPEPERTIPEKIFISVGVLVITAFLIVPVPSSAEDGTGFGDYYSYHSISEQPLELVDSPTAGILDKGDVAVELRFSPEGSLLGIARVGIMQSWQFGFSYRIGNLIGEGEPDWGKGPEFNTRLRIIEESETVPAVVVGFNSMGYGHYFEEVTISESDTTKLITLSRYERKSKGFYCSASKNLGILEGMGLHGGVNYSLETADRDKGSLMSGFMGADLRLSEIFSVYADYDLALNDREHSYKAVEGEGFFPGKGRGYLDIGASWFFADNLSIGFVFRDILGNTDNPAKIPRELRIEYHEHL